MTSLISEQHSVLLFAILLGASILGIYGEAKGWFRKISGVLVTILFMSILATLGIVPSPSAPDASVPVYDFIFGYFVPIAIPLLLFKVQLRVVIRESGRLFAAFLLGSFGVVLGAICAYFLLNPGPEAYKLAGVFIGTYTGGSVNFMAAAATLDFLDSPLFASTIAVDNVFTNFYIMLLFILPAFKWLSKKFVKYDDTTYSEISNQKNQNLSLNLKTLSITLGIAIGIFAVSRILAPGIGALLNTDINLEILLITIFIVILANVFSKQMSALSDAAFDLGMFFLFMFLAVIGAASDLRLIFTSAPVILLFAAIVLVVHFIVILSLGKVFKLSLEELVVASCANAGGPSTVAPLAASLGMRRAVTPAILVAILGYVIGTFLGITTGLILK